MSRAALALAGLVMLAACGVAGPPLPPAGAVEPVAVQGVGLTPEKGGL